MNAKQMSAWKEIVRQCKSRFYSRINVASNVRSDAILAVDALVELVTPELAEVLKWLLRTVKQADIVFYSNSRLVAADKLAARVREALGE